MRTANGSRWSPPARSSTATPAGRVLHAVGDRQHRQAGARVVVAAVHGQRPEMRRGPDEDDQHQQPGFHRHVVGDGGPAQRRRHRAGQAADDDVLRRGRFQQDGVDQRVADEGDEGQPHGQRIDHRVQDPMPSAADDGGKDQVWWTTVRPWRWRGARCGPCGRRFRFDQAVDGEGGAGQQPDAGRAPISTCQPGKPSVARNMPITAQNTASWVTRGLVSAQYWAMRLGGLWRAVWVIMEFAVRRIRGLRCATRVEYCTL
jgi:hypothetical protein